MSYEGRLSWDNVFVSTGQLPADEKVVHLVGEAHQRFSDVDQGQISQVYPALARVPKSLFGISVVDTAGQVHEAGDALSEFTIMSVSKPFVFALVCDRIGSTGARERIGMNAT